jgi:AcrR family transcriptional regulator
VTRRRRLFYERGVHAVGVDLIATEAGVTRKTLYDRFGSKEQIVVEYLADRDERRPAFLAQCLDTAQLTSAARVLAVFDASRAWSAKNSSKGAAWSTRTPRSAIRPTRPTRSSPGRSSGVRGQCGQEPAVRRWSWRA